MKAVQLLVNSRLPKELRDYSRSLDSKGIGELMRQVAADYPDQYEDIVQHISNVGRNASFEQGETISLKDFQPVFDRDAVLKRMDRDIAMARARFKDDEEFKQEREKIWGKYTEEIEREVARNGIAKGNNLAYSIVSGARGKPAQLKAMQATPGIYQDSRGKTIPMFVRHSLAEGLRPAEYAAGFFGARQSVISTKRSTAKGGDLSKQLAQTGANIVVTSNDCKSHNGRLLSIDDESMRGRVLAQDTGPFKAGTLISKGVLEDIKRDTNIKELVVRSPMTCDNKDGICAKCAGAYWNGRRFPRVGDAIGITAANAIGEPITQMALNSKHTGGITGAKKEYSGFEVINQLVQSPEQFPDRATVAEEDGTVTDIIDAPQGGKYVIIGQKKNYVPHGYPVTVAIGDTVEAGDALSEGIVDPGDVVKYKGLGQGRLYWSDRLKDALDASGMKAMRINTEILARNAIDHVEVDDPEGAGDALPGDVVSYNKLRWTYKPDENLVQAKLPSEAVGKYLQEPVLHYSIGTRITPQVLKRLSAAKLDARPYAVSEQPPGFTADMQRLRTASHVNDDFLASMSTSYLSSQLNHAATRGLETDLKSNVHYAPRLAYGEGFGEETRTTGKF